MQGFDPACISHGICQFIVMMKGIDLHLFKKFSQMILSTHEEVIFIKRWIAITDAYLKKGSK